MIKSIAFILIFSFSVVSLSAQDAKKTLNDLHKKYSSIAKYSVQVTYTAESEELGFRNVQKGLLTVDGKKSILTFGPTETWLNDGKAEYIGTKEEDHSELLIYCIGENFEIPVTYGNIFTFYKNGTEISSEGKMIKVVPKDNSYKYAMIKASGNTITELTVVDDMGMSHTYVFTKFTTNPVNVSFTINPRDYAATIDDRKGCN